MILLRPDCLGFESADEPAGLLPAEQVAFELAGPMMAELYAPEIQAATAAVLYYFGHDLGRTTVSLSEFAAALDKALQGLGLRLEPKLTQADLVMATDLGAVWAQDTQGGELAFFVRLQHHLRTQLRAQPAALRFDGLRACVKQLLGARRWSARCQQLADQIVDFLRACLRADCPSHRCTLMVR